MAKKEDVKELTSTEQRVLLTEEEFNKKQRNKTRENINRVTRIFGVISILAIVILGILPFIRLSLFGLIFDHVGGGYRSSWGAIALSGNLDFYFNMFGMRTSQSINLSQIGNVSEGYQALLNGAEWLFTIFITVVIIMLFLAMVYLLAYNIADLIQFFKVFIRATRDLAVDLGGIAKDSVEVGTEKKFPKKEKKSLLKAKKAEPVVVDESIKNEKKDLFEDEPLMVEENGKRRKVQDKKPEAVGGYTSEELDRLLRGETLEAKPTIDPLEK